MVEHEESKATESATHSDAPGQQSKPPLQDSEPVVPVTLANVGLDMDRKVVIDAGAAIKLQRLERFGGKLYTTSGVLAEIRDENARALLRTLPQEIATMEPDATDLAYSKQFAKATGDLGVLSRNDMNLIALTVTLHRQTGGTLRQRPAALGEADESTQGQAGFEWAPLKNVKSDGASTAGAVSSKAASEAFAPPTRAPHSNAEETVPESAQENTVSSSGDATAVPGQANCPDEALGENEAPEELASEAAELAKDDDGDDTDSEDSSGAGDWVTPDNIQHFGIGVQPTADMKVTCVTSDYAVQNVLLQMGITPVTFDGYAVRTVKLWGLICRACFHFTRDTQKVFCPKCGHDTLVRVPIVVDSDGQPRVLHQGRRLRRKGTIYSVPKPQGGRGWKPIFAEDEIKIGSRDREMRHQQRLYDKERKKRDPFNDDNAARGWWQRSTTSTGKSLDCYSAPRVQAGYGRKNPNSANFRFPGKKKR